MAANDKKRRRESKLKQTDFANDSSSEKTGVVAQWFIIGMVAVAVVCLVVGSVRNEFDWQSTLAASGCMVMGIGFVAIGLLELEWLERIIGFTDGLFSGLTQWFWTSWSGSLSDSESVGRRGATVIWVGMGFLVFGWGCLLGLRVV
jgi:hypothetical protein